MNRIASLTAIAGTLFTGSLFGADPFAGTWQVNTGKSKPEPGYSNKSVVLTIEEIRAKTTRWFWDQTRNDGTKSPVEVVYVCDGEEHAAEIHGAQFTTVCHDVDSTSRRVTYIQHKSVTLETVWTLSGDRKVLTGDGKHTLPGKAPYRTVFIYERK